MVTQPKVAVFNRPGMSLLIFSLSVLSSVLMAVFVHVECVDPIATSPYFDRNLSTKALGVVRGSPLTRTQVPPGNLGDTSQTLPRKLHSVKPDLGDWQSSYRRCKKDEVALCRARIGHTYFTHSYILKKDPPPLCEHCQCILTVRHILVECNHFARESKDIFGRRDVVESFRFHPTLIVLFLKQLEFYYKF